MSDGYVDKKAVVEKYLGRKYKRKASGCFLLAKEFYTSEMHIPLKNDYLQMLNDFYVPKHPRVGDLVVFRNHPIVTNHVGVYLGEKEFLHGGHLEELNEVMVHRLDREPYSGILVGFLRHMSLTDD